MATSVSKVSYYSTHVPNRAGTAAGLLGALADAGVNLLAFTGFPDSGGSQVDFVPENAAGFTAVARRMKLALSAKKTGFLIQGDDKAGAVGKVLSRLAKAKINVTAVDAACAGKKRFGAILWVKQKDVAKAAKALGAK
jgi:hypothetical protein